MHKPKIFLVGEDREHLITLEETGYVEEAVLQDYLVDYPDLLPGDQIDPENPRRWLLVAQEMGVPGEEDGSGRWSLDHLFLDQDGIPTFGAEFHPLTSYYKGFDSICQVYPGKESGA